ncbi:hypothetical protein D3C73_689500 [compost metagenome]
MKNQQLGHSVIVRELIELISKQPRQAISFQAYMNMCLYHEEHGYYRRKAVKIGKTGDFYTSSSIGTIMGEMLASYIIQQWDKPDHAQALLSIVEWGGGNGRLALHVLDELQRREVAMYKRVTYTMVESSGFHREMQAETLDKHTGKVVFLSEEDWNHKRHNSAEETVIVIANELLDAFPVHRIQYKSGGLYEYYIGWKEEQQAFIELWFPLQDQELLSYIQEEHIDWSDGQMIEINLASLQWIRSMAQFIDEGQLLIIDYGDTSKELYAAHRQQGTLMCYRQHQAYDEPLIYQGEQDITAHVNFSACMREGLSSGFANCHYTTQREFLVEQGILTQLQNHYDPNPFSEISKRNRSIRQLLVSDHMSELFKVLVLTKKR